MFLGSSLVRCLVRGSASVLETIFPAQAASSSGSRTTAITQRTRLKEQSGSNIGGVQTVKPAGLSTDTGEPITTINYFSGTGNDNLAIVFIASPVNFGSAAGHHHRYESFGFALDHCGDSRGAGTAARSFGLADATLPNPQLNCFSILNTDEYYVCAVWKAIVVFNRAADSSPIERSEVVNKDTAIWISHL